MKLITYKRSMTERLSLWVEGWTFALREFIHEFLSFPVSEGVEVRIDLDGVCSVPFIILEEFYVEEVFIVENLEACTDFKHLLNKAFMLGGQLALLTGVEVFAHSPPCRKGEKIGLVTPPYQ
jgi:hypothetical protein